MNIEEIEARHQEFEGWCVTCMQGEDAGSVPWPCDAAILLAELKEAREKLEAVEKLRQMVAEDSEIHYAGRRVLGVQVAATLGHILKGGD